jgi:hypothetical protein
MYTYAVEVPERCVLRGLDDNSLYRWFDRAMAAQYSATRVLEVRAAKSVVRRIAAELRRRKLPPAQAPGRR